MQHSLKEKRIIVTGASSGIGERLVWHIAKNGGTPILIARSLDKLKDQKQKMWSCFQTAASIYQADVTDTAEYQAVIDEILNDHEKIHGLINNAGIGVFADVDSMEMKDMELMFQLNVYAVINGTKQMLPHFSMNQQVCHVVNVASMAGKVATPKSSVYAATKHAIIGFTDALRLEIANREIYVTSVNLGPVKTAFFNKADPDGSYQKSVSRYILDPDKVAKKIVRHLFRKKREINLPHWMAVGAKIYQLFPGVAERIIGKSLHQK